MNRFFVDKSAVKDRTIEITDREDIKHICKVLRLSPRSCIEVSDSNEFEYQTEIVSVDSSIVVVKILDKQRFTRETELKITLFQGIPKQNKMENIIQKSVELGVHAIVPVFTERTVVTEKQNLNKKKERWNRISAETVKQCKRGIIPQIFNSLSFNNMFPMLDNYDLVLFLYENENEHSLKDTLRSIKIKPKTAALIIGPEGGFSENEADAVIAYGGKSVSLGKTILRTETAGPAAVAMLMYEFEL